MPDIFGEDTLEELRWKIGQAREAGMSESQRDLETHRARMTDPAIGMAPEAARLDRVLNPERRHQLFDFPRGSPQERILRSTDEPAGMTGGGGPTGLPPEEFADADEVYRAIGRAVIKRRQMGPIVVPKKGKDK